MDAHNREDKFARGGPDIKGLKRVCLENGLDFEWDLEAQPFEIQTNGCSFVKNRLKFGLKFPYF